MSRSGWVPFLREWEEHPVISKDCEHYRLWGYLLSNAAYKQKTELLGGKPATLQPGQLTTGRKQIELNTKINESKVQRVLKDFENAHLIEQQTTNKNRLITILCWRELQNIEQQSERQLNNQRTTTEQQPNTLEQINKSTSQQVYKPLRGGDGVDIDGLWEFCWENERYDIDVGETVKRLQATGWTDSNGNPIRDIKKYLLSCPAGKRVDRPRPKTDWIATGEFEGYRLYEYRGEWYKEEDFPAKRWW